MEYSTPYQKVLCRFYDQLEIYSMHKTPVEITWKDASHEAQTIHTTIKTLETKKSEEFLITNEGLKIRLDLITCLILEDGSGDMSNKTVCSDLVNC